MELAIRPRLSSTGILHAFFATAALLIALVASAGAQNLSSGSIDGTVSDDSGGALPGVTATATSPALQVRQVSVTTDAEGR